MTTKLREKGYFNCIDPFTKVHDIIDNCEGYSMIRQAGLMLPRKEYKEPLYRLRQNEYCILLDYEGNIGNKPINICVFLLELKKYGLFRNVPDTVPINKILANCEVIK